MNFIWHGEMSFNKISKEKSGCFKKYIILLNLKQENVKKNCIILGKIQLFGLKKFNCFIAIY